MSLVTVCGKSFAAQLLAVIVRGYKLRDPRKSVGTAGDLITKVDQQIAWFNRVVLTTD